VIYKKMKTFRAGNLEVMREDLDYPDFPLKMDYDEVESLDLSEYPDGWRIPTYEEIRNLYKFANCAAYNRSEWNSQKWSIGGFGDDYYWAIDQNSDPSSFVLFDFLSGSKEPWGKGKLRLVKNIE
jgi:hypothetical protein